MRGALLLFLLISFAFGSSAQQTELRLFNERKDQISQRSMYALGGWAVGNFAMSGAMIGFSSGPDRYFHQMNIYWNVVNAGIAGLGLLAGKSGAENNLFQTLKSQSNTEKIYLLNAGLDVGYLFGGLYLTELARRHPAQYDRLTGFGRSIVLQGSFLLVLDTVMYLIYQNQRTNKLEPLLENVDIGLTGFRIRF